MEAMTVMGMAASQARFLGLTARKSNVEYQGQQVNQQRTALANESANLYNQMMELTVPTPPNTDNFYSTSYILDDSSDSYAKENYTISSVVKTYANENEYLVTLSSKTDVVSPTVSTYKLQSKPVPEEYSYYEQLKDDDGNKLYYKTDASGNKLYHKVDANNRLLYQQVDNEGSPLFHKTDANNKPLYQAEFVDGEDKYPIFSYEKEDENGAKQTLYYILQGEGESATYVNLTKNQDGTYAKVTENPVDFDGEAEDLEAVQTTDETAFVIKTTSKTDFPIEGTDETEYPIETTKSEEGVPIQTTDVTKYPIYNEAEGLKTGLKYPITIIGTSGTTKHSLVYDNYQNDAYTGENGSLNVELGHIYKINPDKAKNGGLDGYDECLSNDKEIAYFYQLKVGDTVKNYFLTEQDLNNLISGNKEEVLYIDNTYVYQKTVSTQVKGYLETSSNGRYSTLQIIQDNEYPENLSGRTFNLSCVREYDEQGYQDAYNDYEYEKYKYEKTISDINAETEVIQSQDRQLELRLKQLDTEENAIKTEMDAVKQVLKDNVEKTFNTFG